MQKQLTVTEANHIARTVLEELTIWVIGEVDSVKESDAYKGVYFSLKDAASVLPCMYWKWSDVKYLPKDGEKISVFGTLTLYEKTGKYQMIVSRIEPVGEGELLKQREELRKRLMNEGYFDESKKRQIPSLCTKIALITSKRGAAIEDFMTNVVSGYAGLEVTFVDALVQGETAVKSIVSAFNAIKNLTDVDVVVLTRGGGSLEDLMCFNSEEIVKAIRGCSFPVISAVGHEVDYTLADLASDLRVSTPTKAAEAISKGFLDYKSDLHMTASLMGAGFNRVFENSLFQLDLALTSLLRVDSLFKELPQQLDEALARLAVSYGRFIENKSEVTNTFGELLNALSPVGVLKRGYSITYNSSGEVVKSVTSVKPNESVTIRVSDGQVKTKVDSVENT